MLDLYARIGRSAAAAHKAVAVMLLHNWCWRAETEQELVMLPCCQTQRVIVHKLPKGE
jgi:hypothetical protein